MTWLMTTMGRRRKRRRKVTLQKFQRRAQIAVKRFRRLTHYKTYKDLMSES